MARQLKVYGGTYDGRTRIIVAAKTKKDAYRAISAAIRVGSYSTWDQHTADTSNSVELAVALSNPLQVFASKRQFTSDVNDYARVLDANRD